MFIVPMKEKKHAKDDGLSRVSKQRAGPRVHGKGHLKKRDRIVPIGVQGLPQRKRQILDPGPPGPTEYPKRRCGVELWLWVGFTTHADFKIRLALAPKALAHNRPRLTGPGHIRATHARPLHPEALVCASPG